MNYRSSGQAAREVADAIEAAGEESGHMTGQVLGITGGMDR